MIKFIWDRCAYEAWCVGIRLIKEPKESLFGDNKGAFRLITPNLLYWYADPIIRDINGIKYVFMEAYNKWNKLGSIAVSRVINDHLSRPRVVLKEPFHLSFPEVFSFKGVYYMIPETHSVSEFRFYKMGSGVRDWSLFKSIKTECEFSDTVVYCKRDKIYLITTEKPEDNPYVNKVHFFCIENFDSENDMIIREIKNDTERPFGYDQRNGGSLLSMDGQLFRVIQVSEKGFYGKCIVLRKIDAIGDEGFVEHDIGKSVDLNKVDFRLKRYHRALGTHTYGICDDYEVIDIKTDSMSIATVFNNIRTKFAL